LFDEMGGDDISDDEDEDDEEEEPDKGEVVSKDAFGGEVILEMAIGLD
jgi:hypothetical protein